MVYGVLYPKHQSKARQKKYILIDESIKYSEPIQITTKKRNAILISEDDWRAIQETMWHEDSGGTRYLLVDFVDCLW